MDALCDFAWNSRLRREDTEYREYIKSRWAIDDTRRAADEKMEQLKAIAETSIIIAGFTLSAICEMQISLIVPAKILAFYGLATSSAVSILSSSSFCTFLLISYFIFLNN